MFFGYFTKLKKNQDFIKRIAVTIAKEYESMPYEVLADTSRPISHQMKVEGVDVNFTAEPRKQMNGDLLVCMDFYADLPTMMGQKPSHRFYKRPDGSVYYNVLSEA